MPPGDAATEYASYVSLLWPLFGLEVDFPRRGRNEGTDYPMLDLARAGVLDVLGADRVSLLRDDHGRVAKILWDGRPAR